MCVCAHTPIYQYQYVCVKACQVQFQCHTTKTALSSLGNCDIMSASTHNVMVAINLSEYCPLLAEGQSMTHHVFSLRMKVLAVCSTKQDTPATRAYKWRVFSSDTGCRTQANTDPYSLQKMCFSHCKMVANPLGYIRPECLINKHKTLLTLVLIIFFSLWLESYFHLLEK